MYINEHTLIHDRNGGNGYHGRCAHCKIALVTDIGYCSWDNVKCIDRIPETLSDMPVKIINYIRFFGLHWDNNQKLFVKPYFEITYTYQQLIEKLIL